MRPITKILIIIIGTMVICQGLIMTINKGYRKFNMKFTELFEGHTNHDVLFLGSSRVYYLINPKIIDSVCGVDSYNAGIDGGNLFEFKTSFDAYLQNHPSPRLVVLNIDLHSFTKLVFFNHNEYYPYLNNKIIKDALSENGYYDNIYKIFPFFIITEYDNLTKGNAIKGLLNKDISDGVYKGYLANGKNYITTPDTSTLFNELEINDNRIADLNGIIDTCIQRHIKLIFTYAPEYDYSLQKHIINAKSIFNLIETIAMKNNILFIRYDSSAICKNPRLFANFGHLNEQGADEYSLLLADQLKKLAY